MRAAALIIALALGACGREPDFDERYAQAGKSLQDKAAEIDAELAERERLASEAAAAVPTVSATGRAAALAKAAK